MSDPYPSDPSIEITSLDAPSAATHLRRAALFSLGGSIATIAGFFLPWFSSTAQNTGGQDVLPSTISLSGWDILTHYATGNSLGLGGSSSVVLPYALLIGIPLLMALLVLAISANSLVRLPTPTMIGLTIAATLIGLLAVVNEAPLFLYSFSLGGTTTGPAAPLTGSGLDLIYLGFFAIVAGSVITLLEHRK